MENQQVLIIVENAKKLLTFQEALDESHYKILSTGGTIRRVLNSDNKWEIASKSKSFLDEIKDEAKKSKEVYLAMDDDTDGERLAWNVKKYIDCPTAYRIVPSGLNKEAIKLALESPRDIDSKVINAQSTRKIIEKMVGRDISNMMRWWLKKEEVITDNEILKNIGIGRVSAAALALIVEAEEKIETFVPEYYKKVAIDYFYNNVQFSVKNRLKFTKDKKEELMTLIAIANKEPHIIQKFEEGTKDKIPPSPLNSILLQRAASYQFSYSPKETMRIAKELYEGVEIDGKRVALITYYKTNSLYLSDETVFKIIQQVLSSYGERYTFTSRRNYKNSENTNDLEAIHPISFEKEFFPRNLQKYLTEEQHRIYNYIYQRTMATQMTSAIYDQSELVMQVGGTQFKTIANKMLFDGWKIIGKYWKEDDLISEYEEVELPSGLVPGDELPFIEVREYEPPPRSPWRYGQGRFLSVLEKHGIANASFVSEITSFLEQKKYIFIEKSMLYPTEMGKHIYYFCKMFAPWLIDVDYVVRFEEDIKLIELGQKDKQELITEYEDLKNELQLKIGYMQDNEVPEEWLIKKAKRVALQKGQTLREDILSSKKRLMHYLKTNKEKVEILGKCPSCKDGEIFNSEHGYKCNNEKCYFIIWHNSVEKFFDIFSKHIPEQTIPKYISMALRKGKFWLDGLYSSKKDKFFDSFVKIGYNEKYKNWSLTLAPYNEETETEDVKNYIPVLSDVEIDTEINSTNTKKIKHLEEKLEKEKEERRLIVDEANKDPMTRAFNRRCFDLDIVNFFNKNKTSLSVAFIDGDKFKDINDTYGHQAGDEVLKFLVNKMFAGVKQIKRGRVYRYGGEEFLILFVDEIKKDVISCVNHIREDIEKNTISYEGQKIKITISAGISFCTNEDDVNSFIERADKAVYLAKENGRNRIEVA